MEKVLKASKEFDVRFSEVDSMNIVWHGSYALYFEDAREEFGRVFGLSYHEYIANEYFIHLPCFSPAIDAINASSAGCCSYKEIKVSVK